MVLQNSCLMVLQNSFLMVLRTLWFLFVFLSGGRNNCSDNSFFMVLQNSCLMVLQNSFSMVLRTVSLWFLEPFFWVLNLHFASRKGHEHTRIHEQMPRCPPDSSGADSLGPRGWPTSAPDLFVFPKKKSMVGRTHPIGTQQGIQPPPP